MVGMSEKRFRYFSGEFELVVFTFYAFDDVSNLILLCRPSLYLHLDLDLLELPLKIWWNLDDLGIPE